MAKFCGMIGYVESGEIEPGLWVEDNITERLYYGELVRNFNKRESSGGVNDNINIANEVSIIADPYAIEHSFAIKYVKFQFPTLGGCWKVTNVEIVHPRMILTIGGLYNGDTAGTSE